MRKLTIIAAALLLSACATSGVNYRPIIDSRGVNPAQYQTDLNECQQYAHRVSAGDSAVAGALAGAILGAIISPRGYRNQVAGKTALIGALGGAGEGVQTQEQIIKRCLAGRGYSVLQ